MHCIQNPLAGASANLKQSFLMQLKEGKSAELNGFTDGSVLFEVVCCIYLNTPMHICKYNVY